MSQISSLNFSLSANQTTTPAPQVGNTPFYTWINVLLFGKILAGTGCVLEVLNIIVFVHPTMRKSTNGCNMNTYLLAKAVCDLYYFIYWLLSQNLLCSSCSGIYRIGWQYTIIIAGYFYSISTSASITFEFLAVFDRYVFISNRFRLYKKIKPKFIVGALLIMSMIFYVPKFFYYKIQSRDKETPTGNVTSYFYTFSDFYYTEGVRGYAIVVSIYRDGGIIIAIILTNLLILFEMRKAFKKKRTIAAGSRTEKKMWRAELNLSLMIVLSGVLVTWGHCLYFVRHLRIPAIAPIIAYNLYNFLVLLFSHLHIQVTFFLYLACDKTFRKTLRHIFFKVVSFAREDLSTHTIDTMRN